MNVMRYFSQERRAESEEAQSMLTAIDRSQAVIEFDLDGKILTANQNFLSTMGYALDEVVGQHHRIFVEPADASSPSYAEFWQSLKSGQFKSAVYKRLGKGGKEVWIQASYNPILDAVGSPLKIVKFATDITESRLAAIDAAGQTEAISRSQAVIEFDLTGMILTANDNFLKAMGYRLDEVRGRHHRMFVEPEYASSDVYESFWAALRRGEFQSAEYKRIAKGGKEVWIQATYNPILGDDGKPVKIVKSAIDITARKLATLTLNDGLQQLAVGDLRATIETTFPGDLEELRKAFNQSLVQLQELVCQIQTATSEVENAAAEISSGTTDLAERTEQAASNLEETAASTEQMSATVRQNAENAKNGNQLAEDANQTASKGGNVVKQAVGAMSDIEGSAQKITDIIGVIDEIAFQTNLLALNASVEAARAGEAGKGFAVVAQEVRALAQRSAQAASDIKTLIQGSNAQVKAGVQLVNQAGDNLVEIVGSIGKVTGIMQEISNASQEQASGVQEINASVTNLDEMTQQNSALVEESTAAARALSEQAGKLGELMAFFKLDNAAMPLKHPSTASRRPTIRKPTRPVHQVKQPAGAPPAMAVASDDDWNEF